MEEKTEEAGALQYECKMMGVGGRNIFNTSLNGSKYLMAVGKINITSKEHWKSVLSGL